MRIFISQQDQTPIYQQIVNQVKLQVSSGRLTPEEELPSIRALAEQLLINPNTVARAYRELEQAGIVTKRRTSGSFISNDAVAMTKQERLELIVDKVDHLLDDARQLSLEPNDLIEVIQERSNPAPKGSSNP